MSKGYKLSFVWTSEGESVGLCKKKKKRYFRGIKEADRAELNKTSTSVKDYSI